MAVAAPHQTARTTATTPRAVGIWLLVCCAMIFAMAVIGAITRLTESGLSIMEWAPLAGSLPPLSQAEWQRLFELYRTIPEYQEINRGMSLAEFKEIFWWEWVHRLWGRLIGVVFLLPFLWFWLSGRLPRGLAPYLWLAFGLGALQGFMGWFMVASGFAERTDVSQYRLAMHLGLALVIYSYLFWLALGLLRPAEQGKADVAIAPPPSRARLIGFCVLLALTILAGAFVAGLNAGLTYNTFPLMDGDIVPAGYGELSPWPLNFFENIAAVQFNHRLLAIATLVAAALLWAWSRQAALGRGLRRAYDRVAVVALAQVGLGIWTLLAVVPVWLGALHQAGAIVLLTAALDTLHRYRTAKHPS